MKVVKLASCKYLDDLPTSGNYIKIHFKLKLTNLLILLPGNEHGRVFRDLEMEQEVLRLTHKVGIGAQFGGKYFCHDVRVIRMPRHGASCPVGIGVSCSAVF